MKQKVPEGQVPLFYQEAEEQPRVEMPYIGPGVEREEITFRAGTRLDHRWTHRIEGRNYRRQVLLGLFDESQRVFQTGGEMTNFIYWKLNLVSLSLEAWRRISGPADWIEIIDHERNECWRISKAKFMKHAITYNAGIGERIGVHRELWTVINSRGNVVQ